VILKPFDPSLGDTSTRKEELFDLVTIEVSVIGERDQDRNVTSGEGSNELGDILLTEPMAGVGGEFANKEWTTE
jgi:hypothetical protein